MAAGFGGVSEMGRIGGGLDWTAYWIRLGLWLREWGRSGGGGVVCIGWEARGE